MIDALKMTFPKAEIHFLTKESFRVLLEDHPAIHSVISLPKKKSNITSIFDLVKTINASDFDYIIDLHANLRSHLICLFSKVPVLKYSNKRWTRLKLVWFKKKPSMTFHTVDHYFKTLEPLGISNFQKKPVLPLSKAANEYIDRFLNHLNIYHEKLIAIAPASLHYTKQWLIERYGRLAKILAEKGTIKVLVIGSKNERELNHQIPSHPNIINVVGQVDLRYLPALLSRCRVLVCNDSGPMHIAGAVGTPVVAIFGSTVPELGFYPVGEDDVIVDVPLSCRPCHLHGRRKCPKDHFLCMTSIEVNDILPYIFDKL